MWASRFARDERGASMVEMTLVLPVFMLIAFGTVDMTLLLYDWSMANKAAYRGARIAVVADPVAMEITTLDYSTNPLRMGDLCFLPSSGVADAAVSCPTLATTCGAAACTNGYTWDEAAFNRIVGEMQTFFPRLTSQNVTVEYRTTGLGFFGRPNGLPMEVTVQITCLRSHFFFISALMRWAFPPLPDSCPADGGPGGPALPPFTTTLISEALGEM